MLLYIFYISCQIYANINVLCKIMKNSLCFLNKILVKSMLNYTIRREIKLAILVINTKSWGIFVFSHYVC